MKKRYHENRKAQKESSNFQIFDFAAIPNDWFYWMESEAFNNFFVRYPRNDLFCVS